MNKKRQLNSGHGLNSKRVCSFDTKRSYEILRLLDDELSIVERILYVSRNQHRGCIYFKSMSNTVRYCRKVYVSTKDILDNLNTYEYIVLADGLLQSCCTIYKLEKHGKKCCQNNYNQVGMTFYVPLCSVFLASTSRLMELAILLLRELVPLHQQIMTLGDSSLAPYMLPLSVSTLLQLDTVSLRDNNQVMELEEIDESTFASYTVYSQTTQKNIKLLVHYNINDRFSIYAIIS